MQTRQATSRTEIDLLPPFGRPEVVTTGNAAADVAFAGLGVVGLISLAANN